MEIEPIGSYEHLNAIQAEWLDLYARDPMATPFQRPEWLLTWWGAFGSGELFSFAVRLNGVLVALAPMFLHSWKNRRQVTLLGNGVSDHLGWLLDPAHADLAAAAIVAALGRERTRWDLCDLQDLSLDSQLCRTAVSDGLEYALLPQYTCSEITLPATADAFRATLSHGIRRNLRRYREHLEARGRVTFETLRNPQEIAASFDTLIELHRARWQSKDGPGMIDSMALAQFHRLAAVALASEGIAFLHNLRLDGRIVAAVYALLERGRAFSYLGGFDPGLRRFSPGLLSLDYAICQAIQEGAAIFDFLRGDEPYKAEWGAVSGATYRLLLWHEKVPADLLEAD